MLNMFTLIYFQFSLSQSVSHGYSIVYILAFIHKAVFTALCLYHRVIAFHWKFYQIQSICIKDMFPFDVSLFCHSFGQSVTVQYFGVYLRNIAFHRIFYKIQRICIRNRFTQNICMCYLFTFDEFSVCHSLGQSVTGIALFIFWLILRNIIAFQRNFINTECLSCALKYNLWIQ